MEIREVRQEDVEEIRKIHSRFYQNEFELPDFLNNFICAFSVIDDFNRIICVGGVRNIAESIIITDKDFNTRHKVNALYKVLDASEFIARASKHSELHAFVQDITWMKHLQKVGFQPTKGKALVLEL